MKDASSNSVSDAPGYQSVSFVFSQRLSSFRFSVGFLGFLSLIAVFLLVEDVGIWLSAPLGLLVAMVSLSFAYQEKQLISLEAKWELIGSQGGGAEVSGLKSTDVGRNGSFLARRVALFTGGLYCTFGRV